MTVTTIGLDIAKSVFQIHGINCEGRVTLRRRVHRHRLFDLLASLPACRIGIEACSGAHYWARRLSALGHDVRLIPPQYVKPYVKRNKTDAADAEAICEAVARPNMRFVPMKSLDQQAILTLHRTRELLIRQRTQLANAVRGLAAEFGIVVPVGIRYLPALRSEIAEAAEDHLPRVASQAILLLFEHLDGVDGRLAEIDSRILAWHRGNELSRRLETVPGIGPITASAIVGAIGSGTQFASARRFAAWIGLTPKITASGGKERIGRISRAGDRYLRTLLIHGARAVIGALRRPMVVPRPWVKQLAERRPANVAATALAHKNARIVWALVTRGGSFMPHKMAYAA
jgi:transposase